MTNRELALKWWASIDMESKINAASKLPKILGRRATELTGREIQSIWHRNGLPSPLPETGKKVVTKDGEILTMNEAETEVLHKGEWYSIQEDQDGEQYVLLNGKAVYLNTPASIPETETGVSIDTPAEAEMYSTAWEWMDAQWEKSAAPPTPGNERPTGEGFTPGEWKTGSELPGDEYNCCILNSDGRLLAQTFTNPYFSVEQAEANARLIASAPAMYRALKRLLPIIEAERTQTGVSLSIRYLTEYEEAKAILNSITGGK